MDPSELTIEQVEQAFGLPTKDWNGNCFGVATAIVKAGLVEGTAVYGHFLGYVDPDGYWTEYAGHPFIQHGWVLLEDGRILDPTRWSFENENPYLALIDESDGQHGEYDEGGGSWREAMRRPCPEADEGDEVFVLELTPECKELVDHMLPDGVGSDAMTIQQLHWLSNASYDSFGPFVAAVYQGISKIERGFIPLDNVQRAKREFRIDI